MSTTKKNKVTLQSVNTEVISLKKQFGTLDTKFNELDAKFDRLEQEIHNSKNEILSVLDSYMKQNQDIKTEVIA